MKKIFSLLVLLFVAGSVAYAQKAPPQTIMTAFNQKFSQVTALHWGREKNGDWEAEFKQDGVEMSANFNPAGQWLETETEIKADDLPAPVRAALSGKKIKEAATIARADGSTVYEAEVRHKDLLFDAAGKLLSEGKN